MEERVKNDGCFRCKAPDHWANNCPNTPKWPVRQCPCGAGPCIVFTSRTENNPNRDFYKCPAKKEDRCKSFKWCDEFNSEVPQGEDLASFRRTSDTGAGSLLSNMMRELNVTSPTNKTNTTIAACKDTGLWTA